MKKVLFLGYAVPKEEQNKYSGISIAGNKMQWNIIKNLALNGFNVFAVSVLPYASFPKEKKIFIHKTYSDYSEHIYLHSVPFINIPILKQISQINGVYKEIDSLIKKEKIKKIICFNLFPQIGNPLRKIKEKFPDVEITCLLADLPIDDNPNRSSFSTFLRKKFEEETLKNFKIPDKFIVLNEYVIDFYKINRPFIVFNGAIDQDDIKTASNNEIKKSILFTGALTEYNGIKLLIDSFKKIDNSNIVLDICGDGPLKEYVISESRRDSRILYHGNVDNKKIIEMQRSCGVLINPRDPNNLISKLTFPSKTFEYILSGRPVVSTKLNCLNSYFSSYLDLCDYTSDDMKEKISTNVMINIFSDRSSLIEKFISENIWSVRIHSIIHFIKE